MATRRPRLAIVTGPPGAGKTTFAHDLAQALPCPVLSRDAIKGGLASPRAPLSPEELLAVGQDAFALFFSIAARVLDAGCDLVVEQTFVRGRSEPELLPLVARSRAVQLYLCAPLDVRAARFAGRADKERQLRRHNFRPGLTLAEIHAMRPDHVDWVPLDLECPLVEVDTTDGYCPAFDDLVALVADEP